MSECIDPRIQTLPRPLVDDIVGNKSIPIIGAGLSLNAELPLDLKMPLWNDIGYHFAKKMKETDQYTSPLEAISAFDYEYSRAKVIENITFYVAYR